MSQKHTKYFFYKHLPTLVLAFYFILIHVLAYVIVNFIIPKLSQNLAIIVGILSVEILIFGFIPIAYFVIKYSNRKLMELYEKYKIGSLEYVMKIEKELRLALPVVTFILIIYGIFIGFLMYNVITGKGG